MTIISLIFVLLVTFIDWGHYSHVGQLSRSFQTLSTSYTLAPIYVDCDVCVHTFRLF